MVQKPTPRQVNARHGANKCHPDETASNDHLPKIWDVDVVLLQLPLVEGRGDWIHPGRREFWGDDIRAAMSLNAATNDESILGLICLAGGT